MIDPHLDRGVAHRTLDLDRGVRIMRSGKPMFCATVMCG
jgi:hypothetical protein